jgi:hypothetical protein
MSVKYSLERSRNNNGYKLRSFFKTVVFLVRTVRFRGCILKELAASICRNTTLRLNFKPEDGSSVFLQNVGIRPETYMETQPREPQT